MRYPSFIAEIAQPSKRAWLWFGVRSGYLTALGFEALALAAQVLELIPWGWHFHALVAAKIVTNTLMWIALRTERGVLELSGLNVLADVAVMTGAIYFTGGQLSPLFPIYLILITVIALATNVGVTLVTTTLCLAFYAVMGLLVHAGVVARLPQPVQTAGGLTTGYVVTDLVASGLILAVPTYYAASILQQLRRREEALEERTRELFEAGRQQTQFMANITHELRTPIHGIMGLSDLVSSGVYGEVTADQKEAQRGIKESASSLLRLIDDLLELARADAGRLAFRTTEVDPAEVLETAVGTMQWMAQTKTLTLEADVADGLPMIETDRNKLSQVLQNLLSNAIKFTPEGGRIACRARREGEHVAFEVEDEGTGIPGEAMPYIFDRFRQVDGSTGREHGGAGIGLALVRALLDRMGGEVRVESVPQRGSTFTVLVPPQPPPGPHGG